MLHITLQPGWQIGQPDAESLQANGLLELLAEATRVLPSRVATRPTRSSQRQRVDDKSRRGQVKALRGRISE